MLSPQQQERLHRRLCALRDSLLQADQTGQEAEQPVELDQARVGRLSRMDALQAQAMSIESGQRRRLALRNIEAALLRLEHGEFGICQNCDEPINPLRLDADPTVTLCIDCANEAGI